MDGRRCSACGAVNPVHADWCSQCFARFDEAAAPPSPEAAGSPPRSTTALAAHESNPLAGLGTAMGTGGVNLTPGGRVLARPHRSLSGRLRIGLRLIGIGFRTAWENPRLLAAPFLAGVATLGVVGLVWLVTGIGPVELAERDEIGVTDWLVIGLVTYSGAVFAVVAESFVVAAATLHFDGRAPHAERVWAIVGPRLGPLVRWAFIKATVSLVFQWLRRKLHQGQTRPLGGALALNAAETAWATLTVLVVPVILYEDEGPGRAIRRSTGLFRKTWGQTLVGGFGLGIAIGALSFAALVVTVPLLILNVVLGVAVGLTLLVLVQLVGSVAAGALVAALYRYATTGLLPGGYRPEEVAVAV